MRDQIGADPAVCAKRQQSEPRTLDGAERNNDLRVRRDGQEAPLGYYAIDSQSIWIMSHTQTGNVASWYNHQPFANIIVWRLAVSPACGLDEQWGRAELVQRKEPGVLGPGLHGKRCLELELVAHLFVERLQLDGVGRQRVRQANAQELRQVIQRRLAIQNFDGRCIGKIDQTDRTAHLLAGYGLEEAFAQCVVKLAEYVVIGCRNPDLLARLTEVPIVPARQLLRVEIIEDRLGPSRTGLRVQQPGRPAAPP